MSGVFSVLSDARTGMFRLQQAKKPWEKELEAEDAKGQLGRKAERAAFQLTPRQLRDHAGAQAALEEAQRVGGPKAAAEQRLERVERKIQELKLAMRYAQGDPQKMAQLAAEAGRLAKEAGRAAKEYGAGIANAAAMGLPGGAGMAGATEITRTTTVTSLTVRQTEVSFSLTVSAGVEGDAIPAPTPPEAGAAEALASGLAEGEAAEAALPAGDDGLPPELAGMVNSMLAGLPDSAGVSGGGTRGERARALIRDMIADNDLKMSRYKEADAFGRRVEGVLHVAKQVVGEAKVANELDESEKRRKERREAFKQIDKLVDGAQKEVNALRQAAFGSKVEGAGALTVPDETAGDGGGPVSGLDGGTVPMGGDAAAGGGLPTVNMLA
ncbi:hypothetical protein [Azospirillum agricola]|uniref:hypothetical protein n=1 Tax=Azospirillum agricola TaxID=1720247 RepID=UPI000A0F39F9|nr:hypothetical protein [Azospirillum agricola]SMH43883.1 hypothetical protein SAMN02982994_1997 [Azospirillum lipoferum]